MYKRGKILTVISMLVLSFGLSCSSEDEDDDDSGGTRPGGGTNTGGDDFRDVNNDGELDPLTAQDFGAAGIPVTAADIEAQRHQACTGWVAEPEPLGATLFMILDASSSMNDAPPEGGPASKWEVTRTALIEAVGLLSDDTIVGLLGYPNRQVSGQAGDPSNCVNIDALQPLVPLGANRQAVIDAINAIQTNTCTPTHDAYNVALNEYRNAQVPGTKYMMLMTDGQPTLSEGCNPGQCSNDLPGSEQPVVDAIGYVWAQEGIRTFVLGCPGSEVHSQTGRDNRWWLSQAAEVGGTSPGNCSHEAEPYCHFDMTGEGINFADELRRALRDIVGQVVACEYAIPVPPEGETIDFNAINFYLYPDGSNPIQILRDPTGTCTQGGWFLDEATMQVRLCPDTCALAQSDPNAKAELMFGCESEILLPE
jgi:hypothetical protein